MNDDLRWLVGSVPMFESDPKEQVGTATESSPQVVQPHSSSPLPVLSDHQVSSLDNSTDVVDDVPMIEIADTGHSIETVSQDDTPVSGETPYVLPPRTTRGVPPRRYDPDYEAKRSRYSVENPGKGNLSQSALAFNTALHGTKLPATVEEALAT